MPQTENKKLNDALTDLENAAKGHGKSRTFTRMEDSLKALSETIDFFYKQAGDMLPVITTQRREELVNAYTTALRACRNYTDGKGESRRSGYGTARVQSVLAIESLLQKDIDTLLSLETDRQVHYLPRVLDDARLTDVELEVQQKDLNLMGADSSVRIPLSMDTSAGTVNGFFTEDSDILSFSGQCLKAEKDYADHRGIALIMNAGKERNGVYTRKSSGALLSKLLAMATVADELIDQGKVGDCLDDPEVFKKTFGEDIERLIPATADEAMSHINKDRESRKVFIDFITEAGDITKKSYNEQKFGGMPDGENIPNRNVGMYRMSTLLGMDGMVAKAERVNLKDKEGNEREGVFQETAEGRDIFHMTDDDPLREIGRNPRILDDPDLIKQVADLQVLDYVCGNTDRHLGNMMYDMQNSYGQWRLAGLKCIDNDRSWGVFNANSMKKIPGHYTLPEDMKVISASTAQALNGITIDKLSLMFKDLKFSNEVLNACMTRVEEICQAIKDKKITVVQDNEFAHYRFKDLAVDHSKGKKWGIRNHFSRIYSLRWLHNEPSDPVSGDIRYNKCTAGIKTYKHVKEMPMMTGDLNTTLNRLKNIRKSFKDSDSIFHVDKGNFKWMNNSLKEAIRELTEIKTRNEGKKEIAEEDALKVDALLRQLSQASKKYVETHQRAGSTMGRARKNGAMQLSGIRVPRLPRDAGKVRNMNFNQASAKINGEQKKPKINLITKRAVKIAHAMENQR